MRAQPSFHVALCVCVCVSLVNITIPHVISIEAKVFRSCISLSNIIIPNSVTKINWGPLKNVKHLPMSQFQIVLIKFALMLFQDVKHLLISQFQIVLIKLVMAFFQDAHHLQIL